MANWDGERIKSARTRKNISQVALANMCGISSKTIMNYESNEKEPSVSLIITMAEKLGVDIVWLLTGIEPSRAQMEGNSYLFDDTEMNLLISASAKPETYILVNQFLLKKKENVEILRKLKKVAKENEAGSFNTKLQELQKKMIEAKKRSNKIDSQFEDNLINIFAKRSFNQDRASKILEAVRQAKDNPQEPDRFIKVLKSYNILPQVENIEDFQEKLLDAVENNDFDTISELFGLTRTTSELSGQ